MKPITRKEQIISAVAEGTTPIKPLTREELILAGEKIPPLTREEYFAEMMSAGGGTPEVIEGTIAEPFSMEVATELWDKCTGFGVRATATTYFRFMGNLVMPLNVYALNNVGDGMGNEIRLLELSIAAPINDNVGTLIFMYGLDHEVMVDDQTTIVPLEHIELLGKIVWSSDGEGASAPTDVSMLIPNSTATKTIISRYGAPIPLFEGE